MKRIRPPLPELRIDLALISQGGVELLCHFPGPGAGQVIDVVVEVPALALPRADTLLQHADHGLVEAQALRLRSPLNCLTQRRGFEEPTSRGMEAKIGERLRELERITNVLFEGLTHLGPAAEVMDAWAGREFLPCISTVRIPATISSSIVSSTVSRC